MWKVTWALLFGASLMLVGCGETSEPGGPGADEAQNGNGDETATNGNGTTTTTGDNDAEENTFEITADGMTINQGEEETLKVSVDRGDTFDDPVDITLSGLPAGVTADKMTKTIEKGKDEVDFLLTAAADAAAGDKSITVTGKGPTGENPADVKVTVTVDKAQ